MIFTSQVELLLKLCIGYEETESALIGFVSTTITGHLIPHSSKDLHKWRYPETAGFFHGWSQPRMDDRGTCIYGNPQDGGNVFIQKTLGLLKWKQFVSHLLLNPGSPGSMLNVLCDGPRIKDRSSHLLSQLADGKSLICCRSDMSIWICDLETQL